MANPEDAPQFAAGDGEALLPGHAPEALGPADESVPAELPFGAAVAGQPPPFRRVAARRSADQYDMLSDDAGDHHLEVPHDDPNVPRPSVEWDRELSTQRIGGELRRIEAEVRQILEGRDLKRKRKMAGTRRWQELEEDIIAWQFSGRIDDTFLERLRDLIVRRHHLFRRLRFLASTRPTWNS